LLSFGDYFVMVSTTSQIQRAYALLLPLFFASVAVADTAVAANDIPEPEDENINPVFMQDETIPGFLLKEDVGEAGFLDIDIIPKCVVCICYPSSSKPAEISAVELCLRSRSGFSLRTLRLPLCLQSDHANCSRREVPILLYGLQLSA
jgi:hypothetical protein